MRGGMVSARMQKRTIYHVDAAPTTHPLTQECLTPTPSTSPRQPPGRCAWLATSRSNLDRNPRNGPKWLQKTRRGTSMPADDAMDFEAPDLVHECDCTRWKTFSSLMLPIFFRPRGNDAGSTQRRAANDGGWQRRRCCLTT